MRAFSGTNCSAMIMPVRIDTEARILDQSQSTLAFKDEDYCFHDTDIPEVATKLVSRSEYS